MAGTQPMDAWRDWLQSHGGRFLLFARQQTRREADAEDVVQDAMMRLWNQRVGKGEASPPMLPEAFAAMRRCAIDLARRNLSREAREQTYDQEAREPVCWFENTLESEERARVVGEALRRLPATHQEVVVLKIWGELTFAQIAAVLGIPLNTAASRYRYGLDGLRRHLSVSAL